MFNAIYYPHTAIRDENFLKHALLYWDEIEFVSPFDGYDVSLRYPDSLMRQLSKFTKARVPTEQEKRSAHAQIMDLISGDLPSWLMVDQAEYVWENYGYYMFSRKLLPETWEELRRRKLVRIERGHGGFDDHVSHSYLGLTMMAILARCCAGTLKHTITDQNDSYFALLKHLQFLSGESEAGRSALDESSQRVFRRWLDKLGAIESQGKEEARQALISITLDVIDATTLAVEDLLKLRNDKTKFAAELRQNYAKALEQHVASLSDPDLGPTDVTALLDDFRRTMQQDLDRLRDELKLNALKTLLSKEVAVAIAAPSREARPLLRQGRARYSVVP